MTTTAAPTVLVIFDGWGCSPRKDANAIALARTPAFTRLMERYPHTTLNASGEAVGLPAGQMGNSEVGHMNMGAGRVAFQDLTRIDRFIADREFFANPVLTSAMARCAGGGRSLHLVGLPSRIPRAGSASTCGVTASSADRLPGTASPRISQ